MKVKSSKLKVEKTKSPTPISEKVTFEAPVVTATYKLIYKKMTLVGYLGNGVEVYKITFEVV